MEWGHSSYSAVFHALETQGGGHLAPANLLTAMGLKAGPSPDRLGSYASFQVALVYCPSAR